MKRISTTTNGRATTLRDMNGRLPWLDRRETTVECPSFSVLVPLCQSVAARHLDDYQSAVVAAIRARGDVDTNAAIVGGIFALATGADGIPKDWRAGREGLAS